MRLVRKKYEELAFAEEMLKKKERSKKIEIKNRLFH